MVAWVASGKVEDAFYLLSAVVRREMPGDPYGEDKIFAPPGMESSQSRSVKA